MKAVVVDGLILMDMHAVPMVSVMYLQQALASDTLRIHHISKT